MNADVRDPGAAAPFDWNRTEAAPQAPPAPAGGEAWLPFGRAARPVEVLDETLRDGIQGVSIVNPPRARRIELLHAMASVGVDVVNLGIPAAGPGHFEDACLLAREIVAARLPLALTAAARTIDADVEAIARVAERVGTPIEAYAFIGSSPIRHFVEGWGPDFLVRRVEGAARAAAAAGLSFCLVAEDATRSPPEALRALFRAAVGAGAARVCLCDTTGHVTPPGVAALIAFARRELAALGAARIALDWHGHNDRGLGLSAALWAVACGVERVHATALGVGERAGNSSLELLLDNLGRLGARPAVPRERLAAYCAVASRALGWPIPADHPIAGARLRAPPPRGAAPAEPVEPALPAGLATPERAPRR
ncbi:uncharacterized protein SOCEGT47_077810 [Sorangium cellulosum]|uniref:2-isopropylmalate synthase n=1 Tax=Sorangium cellulosum TaxID=56 RepID=A0A4P2QBV4_SORCE|nr:2-isopropylmalate synthase [Sorangium cellulosum]AUX27200.1 uncharacterized protein SOCEGT47_077810 [Sorangium cellulosum]